MKQVTEIKKGNYSSKKVEYSDPSENNIIIDIFEYYPISDFKTKSLIKSFFKKTNPNSYFTTSNSYTWLILIYLAYFAIYSNYLKIYNYIANQETLIIIGILLFLLLAIVGFYFQTKFFISLIFWPKETVLYNSNNLSYKFQPYFHKIEEVSVDEKLKQKTITTTYYCLNSEDLKKFIDSKEKVEEISFYKFIFALIVSIFLLHFSFIFLILAFNYLSKQSFNTYLLILILIVLIIKKIKIGGT